MVDFGGELWWWTLGPYLRWTLVVDNAGCSVGGELRFRRFDGLWWWSLGPLVLGFGGGLWWAYGGHNAEISTIYHLV